MTRDDLFAFLSGRAPYEELPEPARRALAEHCAAIDVAAGETIYRHGETLDGVYVIVEGAVSIADESGAEVSHLQSGNSFGERGLLREGRAVTTATADQPSALLLIPAARFTELFEAQPPVRRFFDRSGSGAFRKRAHGADLASMRIADLMHADPLTCAPDITIREAAALMRDKRISSLCVAGPRPLEGIVTVRDITNRVVAAGADPAGPVGAVMTPDPVTLQASSLGSDVLHLMVEHGISHLPIMEGEALVGIVTQTDLIRRQAASSAGFVAAAAQARDAADLARITARIPELLAGLVGGGNRHDVVTRLITDIADVATRRLLALAEEAFGPAPAPYVWAACGSQGRQEQTGVSDQDNCLILAEGADPDDPYFEKLARFVCDGLNACGYVYCPGEMMATTPRWRQPVDVWRGYFRRWIDSPSKEAQMLASVMFDLRPIGGQASLFKGLQAETLEAASKNSIFMGHMAQNALSHSTPLGLLRGIATIRSGEHRDTIDMKMNGVVPVVDLGRMYALKGRLPEVNSRARLEAAIAARAVSESGGRDLLDAYDLIAQLRLEHQARQARAGEKPDNFLPPAQLSDFERSHLRDAYVVVKTMQSALMQGRGMLG